MLLQNFSPLQLFFQEETRSEEESDTSSGEQSPETIEFDLGVEELKLLLQAMNFRR